MRRRRFGVFRSLRSVRNNGDAERSAPGGRSERFGERVSERRFGTGRRVGKADGSVDEFEFLGRVAKAENADVEPLRKGAELVLNGREPGFHRFKSARSVDFVANRHALRKVAEKNERRRKFFFFDAYDGRSREKNGENRDERQTEPERDAAAKARKRRVVRTENDESDDERGELNGDERPAVAERLKGKTGHNDGKGKRNDENGSVGARRSDGASIIRNFPPFVYGDFSRRPLFPASRRFLRGFAILTAFRGV